MKNREIPNICIPVGKYVIHENYIGLFIYYYYTLNSLSLLITFNVCSLGGIMVKTRICFMLGFTLGIIFSMYIWLNFSE